MSDENILVALQHATEEIELLEQRLELALGASRNPKDITEIERLRDALDEIESYGGAQGLIAREALRNE